MPANKYALLRYRIIHRCLSNKYHPFPDKSYLRQQCEEEIYGTSDGTNLSEKTIERDLRDMRDDDLLGYRAPILYSREHKGYYYGDPDYDIDRKPLSAEESDALAFAATTLFQFRDVGMFQPFAFAIEKIFEQLQLGPERDQPTESIVQFETVPWFRGAHFLKTIFQSVRNQKCIKIIHRKYQDDNPTSRVIDPYLLKEYRNRWYVIGFDHEKQRVQSFGLDRLLDVEVLEQLFVRQKEFDPEIYFRHSIGITEAGLKPEKVVLEFTPLQGKYLKTQPLHQSQQILKDNEKEFTISLEVLLTFELYQMILGYGPQVIVLEPDHLKNDIEKRLKQTLEQYSSDNSGIDSEE